MTVSIIIPTYNSEKYIEKTIKSVLAQSYKDFELLIIDDFSTDGTTDIVRKFSDPRIKLYINECNLGAGESRNRGISLAKNKYIAFCDSDDIMHKDRIKKQYFFMEENPEIDICGTWANITNDNDEITGNYKYPLDHDKIDTALFTRCAFLQSTAFIRTSKLNDNIRYKSNNYAEDFDLWCNAVRTLRFANIPQFLINYRVSDSQTSCVKFENQKTDAIAVMGNQFDSLGLKYDRKLLEIHYELNHCKGIKFPQKWYEEYIALCIDSYKQNLIKRRYDKNLFKEIILKLIKKALYRFNNKAFSKLKTYTYYKHILNKADIEVSKTFKPKISIITVVKNADKTIRQTIESVKKIRYDNIEYIVIDGDSKDRTKKIISEYPDVVNHFISAPDSGIYNAMNKAVEIAKGDYLYFLGGDDLILEDFSYMAKELKDPNTIYYGNVMYKQEKHAGKFDTYRLTKMHICHQSMFYPKNVFKKYRYNEKYKVAADHVLTLKCIGDKQFKFKYCDWIVARFNTGGATENGDTIFEIEKENLFIEHLGYIPHLRYRIRKFKEGYRKRRVSVRQTMNKP